MFGILFSDCNATITTNILKTQLVIPDFLETEEIIPIHQQNMIRIDGIIGVGVGVVYRHHTVITFKKYILHCS